MKNRSLIITGISLLGLTGYAEHPYLLTMADQHDAIVQKVETVEWAKSAFAQLQERMDHYVAETANDPQWAVSEMIPIPGISSCR